MFRKSLTVLDITKMKEKLLIVGAGGFGRVTLEHAIKDFDCSFVDDGKSIGEEINGVKVVGGVSDLPSLFTEYKKLVLSIGNNNIRENIYINRRRILDTPFRVSLIIVLISAYTHPLVMAV